MRYLKRGIAVFLVAPMAPSAQPAMAATQLIGDTLAKVFFDIANEIFKRSFFMHGLIERKRGTPDRVPLFVRKMRLYLQDKMAFMKVEETFSAHFSELERQTAALNRQVIGELLP